MTVNIPCKIGDEVWAIRKYKKNAISKKGIVSEMFFIEGMQLCIVVKDIARGCWGETVFATKEDADNKIRKREEK